jgi:hypothetical protein
MINVFEIRFKKTWNLGNYESETLEAACQLTEGECAVTAKEELIAFVKGETVKEQPAPTQAVETEQPKKAEKKVAAKKEKAPPVKTESPVVDEAQPVKEDAVVVAPAVEPVVEEVKEEAAPKAKKEKKFKAVATPYNRENDLHKKLLGELLDKSYPTWKKDPSKAKAASQLLAGKDFLDTEGKVIESFKSALAEAMA